MNRSSFLKLSAAALPLNPVINTVKELENFTDSLGKSAKQPVLFLGHGSPMNAIEDNEFVREFKKLGKSLEMPKAILCVSAHWYTKGTKVMGNVNPPTIHDFGGFPAELFAVQYPAKGSPDLALEIQKELLPVSVDIDQSWGLDHGSWSVIKHLYPNANVPVIQLSIDYNLSPQQHFELAQRLGKMREKGVLIVGSGNIVHNLRMVDFRNMAKDNYGYDWAKEARATINNFIEKRDFKSLCNYKSVSEALNLAIPTPDHYLPLIYTLALAGSKENILLFNDKMVAGSLSMTSLKIS
jgi:4,5-DOPA dioxygenase extradiol